MTRKRYINLIRAILTETAKDSSIPGAHKGWEKCFRSFPTNLRTIHHGKYSYDELFAPVLKPLAHKYGIGGY